MNKKENEVYDDSVELDDQFRNGDAEKVLVKQKKAKNVKQKIILALVTLALSIFLCAFYYLAMALSSANAALYYFFPIVMFSYMGALTVIVLVYIIYNRGFSRKGITVEMLPADWSEEKRIEFVESAEKRLKRSKWLLVLIIAFLFTFVVEALILFVIPLIKDFFGKIF